MGRPAQSVLAKYMFDRLNIKYDLVKLLVLMRLGLGTQCFLRHGCLSFGRFRQAGG